MADHGLWATQDFLAEACVKVLSDTGFFGGKFPAKRVMDPASGDGAFIRAFYEAGAPADEILWNELKPGLMADVPPEMYGRGTEGIDFIGPDFQDRWLKPWLEYPGDVRFIGNPPYADNGGEKFVRRTKQFSRQFAYLLPSHHLEPADTRWADFKDTANRKFFPDHYVGLDRIFPLRRVKYRDMTGEKDSTGSRPVSLFVWDMSDDHTATPVIDWALHRECLKTGYGKDTT